MKAGVGVHSKGGQADLVGRKPRVGWLAIGLFE
jgi:hypothetical protein